MTKCMYTFHKNLESLCIWYTLPAVLFICLGIDSKIRFSIEPLPGDDAFNQWKDAMKAVARLPMGIPPEFRKKV